MSSGDTPAPIWRTLNQVFDAVGAELDCNVAVVAAPVVLQDEQQRTSVPPGVSVRRRPARWRHGGHALPEILSRWTHHVDPCVPRHHHPKISGICLHQLPATGRRYCVCFCFTFLATTRFLSHRKGQMCLKKKKKKAISLETGNVNCLFFLTVSELLVFHSSGVCTWHDELRRDQGSTYPNNVVSAWPGT